MAQAQDRSRPMDGRTVLVAGGTGGIGKATALDLATAPLVSAWGRRAPS